MRSEGQVRLAVLDTVGSERAAIFAPFGNSGDGIIFAARHPERVSGLIVVNGMARTMWAPDYPVGLTEEDLDPSRRLAAYEADAAKLGFDVLDLVAPSVSHDATFRSWWDRSGNLGAGPAMAKVIWEPIYGNDVRDLLPMIHVPTLVIHRSETRYVGVKHGRYLAGHIPGVTYVELPGPDTLHWVGDTGVMLDEIEEFLTGVRAGRTLSGCSPRCCSRHCRVDTPGCTDR